MPFDPQAFANADASGFGGDEPPAPGEYEVRLDSTDIFTARDGERQFAKLTWQVISGYARDHSWGSVHTLDATRPDGEPNAGLAVTKGILRDVGIDVDKVESIADLRHELDRVQGNLYIVEVSKNGQYVNTNPRRQLQSFQESMPTPPSTTTTPANGASYGQARSNAIYQGDAPASATPTPEGQGVLGPDEVRREGPVRTGESDVPGAVGDEFRHPPQKGDVDPETGEPIPF